LRAASGARRSRPSLSWWRTKRASLASNSAGWLAPLQLDGGHAVGAPDTRATARREERPRLRRRIRAATRTRPLEELIQRWRSSSSRT
jgi:hypothetical protein